MDGVSIRRVRIVLLCEDSQHEAFVRRFLEGMGWNTREIRVERSPSAKGSAEQWVRERFPHELKVYRQRKQLAASALIAMIDADKKEKEVQDRINEFEFECKSKGIPFRTESEAVAIAVPKRNIETWIHYLNGQQVDEENEYQKLDRKRSCQSAVNRLVEYCKTTGLTAEAPSSLAAACEEYRNKIRPLA
jgi:hypothetical protein